MSERGDRTGATIGRYVVAERIGRGGMGEVYAAFDPVLGRRVALKVLRARRSESERQALVHEAQALAKLAHRGIVAVHDVGVDGAEVFIARELVEGETLRTWLRIARRSPAQVRAVLAQAGRALAYAHERGVVHQDFKPDNVIVDNDGQAHVIDFGLAIVGAAPADDAGGGLGGGTLAGTPAYMAPEQHRGRRADARTDQWAFAATAYEALCGVHPFPPDTADSDAAGSSRSHDDDGSAQHSAPLSSALAAAVASARGQIAPPRADREVPTALLRALARALSPSPPERFPTLRPLLVELEADHERRSRVRHVVAALALASLAFGAFLLTGQDAGPCAQPASAAQSLSSSTLPLIQRAAREAAPRGAALAQSLRRVTSSVGANWTRAIEGACAVGGDVDDADGPTARSLACVARVERRTTSLASLLSTSATEGELLNAPEALAAAGDAAACSIQRSARGSLRPPLPPDAAAVEEALAPARSLLDAGRAAAARQSIERLLAPARRAGHASTEAVVLHALADAKEADGDHQGAARDAALALQRAIAGGDDETAAQAAATSVWVVGGRLDRFDEARSLAGIGQALLARAGGDPLLEALLESRLGNLDDVQGNYAESFRRHQRALDLRQPLLSDDHPDVVVNIERLAVALDRQGRWTEAVGMYQKAIDGLEKLYGPEHHKLGGPLSNLGMSFRELGKFDDAERVMRRALAVRRNILGPDHRDVGFSSYALGGLRIKQGDLQEASVLLEDALRIWELAFGPDGTRTASALNDLGVLRQKQERYEDALALFRRALAIREKKLGVDDPTTAGTVNNIGNSLSLLGDDRAAIPYFERALAAREKRVGPVHPSLISSLRSMGESYANLGDKQRALPFLERALAIAEGSEANPTRAQELRALIAGLRGTGGR